VLLSWDSGAAGRRGRGGAGGGGSAEREAAARVRVAARAWMAGYGGGQGLLIGRRPIWACAPVMEGRRDHCRGLRAGVARGLKERDDSWARRGSEGERGDARAVSGGDAGLLGARGADRWGRRLRRVARAERARLWSGRAGLAAQEGVGR